MKSKARFGKYMYIKFVVATTEINRKLQGKNFDFLSYFTQPATRTAGLCPTSRRWLQSPSNSITPSQSCFSGPRRLQEVLLSWCRWEKHTDHSMCVICLFFVCFFFCFLFFNSPHPYSEHCCGWWSWRRLKGRNLLRMRKVWKNWRLCYSCGELVSVNSPSFFFFFFATNH